MYTLLKQESLATNTPITKLVLCAIEEWHRNKERAKVEKELTLFVENYQWTKDDEQLSTEFENASLESLEQHE